MAHYVFDISKDELPDREHPSDIEEYCPECENTIPINVDPGETVFHVICPVCGHYLLLCSMCTANCDWSEEDGCVMDRGGARRGKQTAAQAG